MILLVERELVVARKEISECHRTTTRNLNVKFYILFYLLIITAMSYYNFCNYGVFCVFFGVHLYAWLLVCWIGGF